MSSLQMAFIVAIVIAFLKHGLLVSSARPNIVFIIADDMGWNDVGFHGGDTVTPNIDALAYNGVILTRHYSQPLCTPSRAALLTGDYPFRHGMQNMPCIAGVEDGLPPNIKIMPQYFSEIGYKTHLIGKWHLGYESLEQLPTRRGFDTFFGYLNGYLGYWDCTHYTPKVAGRDMRRNEEVAWDECYGRYLTDVLTEEALMVIKNHEEEEGLFMILAHAAVHTTYLETLKEAPLNIQNVTGRGYLRAMAERLDWSVGEVTTALKEKGLLNNTIIVFISDNGAPTDSISFTNYGSNWPLRGQKSSVHEGGVRTVATLWSPLLKNLSRTSDQYFHITDWLPTLYTAAGGDEKNLECKDGVDQWTNLISSNLSTRNQVVININEEEATEALIKNNWKLVKNRNPEVEMLNDDHYYGESGQWMTYDIKKVNKSKVAEALGPVPDSYEELRGSSKLSTRCADEEAAMNEDCHKNYCLFDITRDPTECYNLAKNHKEVVEELKTVLDEYRSHLVFTAPKYFDKRASPSNWNDYWSPWLTT